MPNQMDAAFVRLRSVFQTVTNSNAVMTYGNVTVSIVPADIGIMPTFVDGGEADAAQVSVQTRALDWAGSPPPRFAVVTLSGHPSAANGTYQIRDTTQRAGAISFVLGNPDTQQ